MKTRKLRANRKTVPLPCEIVIPRVTTTLQTPHLFAQSPRYNLIARLSLPPMVSTNDSPTWHPSVTARAGLVALLLLLLATVAPPVKGQAPGDGLFSPAEPSNLVRRALPSADDITVRQRVVTIDFDSLKRFGAVAQGTADAPARLTLNLFDDTVLTAIVERTVPTSSGYSLWGRIEGADNGSMTLVVNGTVVVGSVDTVSGTYRIRSVAKQLYAISEVDESKLPPTE